MIKADNHSIWISDFICLSTMRGDADSSQRNRCRDEEICQNLTIEFYRHKFSLNSVSGAKLAGLLPV